MRKKVAKGYMCDIDNFSWSHDRLQLPFIFRYPSTAPSFVKVKVTIEEVKKRRR